MNVLNSSKCCQRHLKTPDAILDAIYPPSCFQIHQEEPPGDILVFLTGQEDIESLTRLLQERAAGLPAGSPPLAITPIYAALPPEQQLKAFRPAPRGARKVRSIVESGCLV